MPCACKHCEQGLDWAKILAEKLSQFRGAHSLLPPSTTIYEQPHQRHISRHLDTTLSQTHHFQPFPIESYRPHHVSNSHPPRPPRIQHSLYTSRRHRSRSNLSRRLSPQNTKLLLRFLQIKIPRLRLVLRNLQKNRPIHSRRWTRIPQKPRRNPLRSSRSSRCPRPYLPLGSPSRNLSTIPTIRQCPTYEDFQRNAISSTKCEDWRFRLGDNSRKFRR